MPINTTDIESVIISIFKNASLTQTRQFSGCESLHLVDMDDNYTLGQVVSHQATLIVISSEEMSVLFKIHFNPSESERLQRHKFPDAPVDPCEAQSKNVDYMKELTNQICGQICRIFHLNQLSLGMSIPLSMRGFYELYSDYTPENGILQKFGHAWRLAGDFGSLVCTSYVEIMKPDALTNIQYIDEPEDDDDELEFL